MPEFRFEIRLSRDERKQQTRERLLGAAAGVFAQRGFAAATLDEIAEAAGFTKGAVYSNFESKSDLFAALIERRIERETGAELARQRGLTLDEMFAEATTGTEEVSAEDREWMVLSCQFWLHALNDEQARKALAREYERCWKLNADLLTEKYAEAGVELPMPAREYAILAEAIGMGIVFQHMMNPEAVPLSIATRGLMRLLGRPIGPAAPEAPAAPGSPVVPDPAGEKPSAEDQPRTGG